MQALVGRNENRRPVLTRSHILQANRLMLLTSLLEIGIFLLVQQCLGGVKEIDTPTKKHLLSF